MGFLLIKVHGKDKTKAGTKTVASVIGTRVIYSIQTNNSKKIKEKKDTT